MKRRILKEIWISRISAVDRPCQEHAKAVILKRDFSDKQRENWTSKAAAAEAIQQRIDKLQVMILGKRLKMLQMAKWPGAPSGIAPTLKKPKGSKKLRGASLGGTYSKGGPGSGIRGHHTERVAEHKAAAEHHRYMATQPSRRISDESEHLRVAAMHDKAASLFDRDKPSAEKAGNNAKRASWRLPSPPKFKS